MVLDTALSFELASSDIQFYILQVITAILVGLGVLLALIFPMGTKEPLYKDANPDIPLRKLSTLQAANFAVSSGLSLYAGLL